MSLVRSVGRNAAIQFVGKIFSTLLGVIVAALLFQYLKPAGYGQYTAAMAYVSFFSVIADLGLYLILMRELNKPRADTNRIVGNLLGMRWASALTVLVGSALVAWVLPFYSPEVKSAIQIGTVAFIAVAGTQLLVAVFQTNFNTIWVTLAELAGRLVLLGLTLAVTLTGGTLNQLMWAVAAGSIVNLLLIYWSARRYTALRPRFEWGYWRAIIRDTLPVSISIVLSLIYFKADTILLSFFQKGDYAVGLYGAAYKVLEILITFPIIFVGLLLPALGQAFSRNDKDGFVRVFQRGFETLVILVTPITIGGWVLARDILVVLGKEEYAPAASVLQLLLIAVTLSFLNSLSAHTITIINRQRQMVWGYLSVAVIGLITYVLLIPRLSYTGAAIGTILTEFLTPLIGYIIIFRVMRFRVQLQFLPKVMISGAVMWLTLWALVPVQPWVALVVGGLVYVAAIFLTKTVTLQTVRQVFGRQQTVDVLPPA